MILSTDFRYRNQRIFLFDIASDMILRYLDKIFTRYAAFAERHNRQNDLLAPQS